jgi:chromate reductase, NAD(P)H dehydrogenase (quinone)
MAAPARILALAGSARRDSLNRRFLAAGIEAVRSAGAEVTLADLNELVLPLYHGDLEDRAGLPENATKLIAMITAHDGLLVASPEYNSMITPLLKNTIDWCSRADDNPFEGKVAAVLSASPGVLGGIRSLQMAQMLLLKLGCHIVPGQCHLPQAHKAFDPAGKLIDERAQKALQALAASLVKTVSKLEG